MVRKENMTTIMESSTDLLLPCKMHPLKQIIVQPSIVVISLPSAIPQ